MQTIADWKFFQKKGLYLWILCGTLSYVNTVNVKEWGCPLFRLCMADIAEERKKDAMTAENGKGGRTVRIVWEMAEPVAQSLHLILWDVLFIKEGASWFLRIFIDKDGGVTLDDCEAFSRAVEPLLDERDPIGGSYYLSENWIAGANLRGYQWFLPDARQCSPIGDCATLTGSVQVFEFGLTIGYRLPL